MCCERRLQAVVPAALNWLFSEVQPLGRRVLLPTGMIIEGAHPGTGWASCSG